MTEPSTKQSVKGEQSRVSLHSLSLNRPLPSDLLPDLYLMLQRCLDLTSQLELSLTQTRAEGLADQSRVRHLIGAVNHLTQRMVKTAKAVRQDGPALGFELSATDREAARRYLGDGRNEVRQQIRMAKELAGKGIGRYNNE